MTGMGVTKFKFELLADDPQLYLMAKSSDYPGHSGFPLLAFRPTGRIVRLGLGSGVGDYMRSVGFAIDSKNKIAMADKPSAYEPPQKTPVLKSASLAVELKGGGEYLGVLVNGDVILHIGRDQQGLVRIKELYYADGGLADSVVSTRYVGDTVYLRPDIR